MIKFQKILIISCMFMVLSCAGVFVSYDARQSFEKGLALFNQGKYEKALSYFEKAIEREPEYTKAHLYLGRSFLNLGKWFEAIPPLRTAYRLSPQETRKEVVNILIDALIGGALSELKKGNFERSINYLREAMDIQPGSTSVRNELTKVMIENGSQLLSDGKASEAIAQFSEAITLAPENLDAYHGLARAFLKNGDFMKAVSTINDALQRAPTDKDKALFRDLLTQ